MTIIHIVTSIEKINFGIWNAAIFGHDYLQKKHGVRSVLLVTAARTPTSMEPHVETIFLENKQVNRSGFIAFLSHAFSDITNTLVVTHGCWRLPTQLGAFAMKKGYKWIYVPHGMLEPWSIQHRKWKKLFYFHLVEKKLALRANVIRAVSSNEQHNLCKLFSKKIALVENGVVVPPYLIKPGEGKTIFLFMARLHFKKGITPLVKAWYNTLRNNPAFEMVIAGPNEGELSLIQPLLGGNIIFKGPLYGEDKRLLLQQSHYYILPSLSEGFPVSVLEAMSYGCIPVISEGCNFNAVFEKKLGYKVTADEQSIEQVLSKIAAAKFDHNLSKDNATFINNHYSEEVIGKQLLNLYQSVQ